jgi:hypothetical protein
MIPLGSTLLIARLLHTDSVRSETGQMIKHELVHTRTAVQGIQSGMASVQLGSQTIQHEVGQTRREVQNVQDSVDTVQRGIGAAHLDLKVAANHVTNLHFGKLNAFHSGSTVL